MKPPKGFKFRKLNNGKVQTDTLVLATVRKCDFNALSFYVGKEGPPVLPFIASGELWHTGWDIPTRYVVDSDKRCWMDNAHGHSLEIVSSKALLSSAEQFQERAALREILSIKPELPNWMSQALRAGWIPPDTYNREDYE